MSQCFRENGSMVPTTILLAPPCTVVQIKTLEHDGYKAIKIGLRKAGSRFYRLREFLIKPEEIKNFEVGKSVEVSNFKVGAKVKVIGCSKGRGFAGNIKRHGFHGHPPTHGHKDSLRMPGSIGQAGIQRVFKGMRMAGRMGNARVTIKNLEVMSIDPLKHILELKGAVPGARNSLVLVQTD